MGRQTTTINMVLAGSAAALGLVYYITQGEKRPVQNK